MSFNPSDFHPQFIAAMDALARIPEAEIDTHPAVADLIAQLMAYAPNELKAVFRAKAKELGLLPEPQYYTEDGEPVYTAAQVANHFGISLEEANQVAGKIYEEHPDLARPFGAQPLFRCQ